jgi:hypothetical protein
MATYLGFLKNLTNGEEFVAPVDTISRDKAESLLRETYPQGIYGLLTVYERREMENILTNIDRWPGVPSKVQPSLEQVLAKVSVSRRGGLPPMPHQRNQAQIDGARVEQVRGAAQGMAPEVQALAARLLAKGLVGQVKSTQASTSVTSEMVSDRRYSAPVQPRTPPGMPAATPQRPTLIDVLKSMRK